MYKENYIESLRSELVDMVRDQLSPLALKYGYSDVPLESNIKWRPVVLILGNYSSGKSTLINELVGGDIQTTGQAPTDDSFTVITHDDNIAAGEQVRVTEERDGKVLLNDPEFPFEILRKHGQRFSSHFRLKKVSSPFLQHLALIDTPGMLDSISERDRGYEYQEVIGDLAQIADLILVLFDPHKAGTVREAHASLRDTLPGKTFEDRVLFVLNRVDECSNLNDLLRVYGTLCWNLSQMTGRKDIPLIRLTYSAKAHESRAKTPDLDYLKFLDNQRDDLKNAILDAPKFRLDNLATYVETHSERLGHLLEALLSFRRKRFLYLAKSLALGIVVSCGVGALTLAMLQGLEHLDFSNQWLVAGTFGGGAVAGLLIWMMVFQRVAGAMFKTSTMNRLENLTPLLTQSRKDSWNAIEPILKKWLQSTSGRYKTSEVKSEFKSVKMVYKKGAVEIREALKEISTIRH